MTMNTIYAKFEDFIFYFSITHVMSLLDFLT